MRNRWLPRVPTLRNFDDRVLHDLALYADDELLHVRLTTSGSKKSGCSLRLFGGVRLIDDGVLSCGSARQLQRRADLRVGQASLLEQFVQPENLIASADR